VLERGRRPNNVRLFFPRLDAELWENFSFLSGPSPYFKALLASNDSIASVRRTRKRAKIEEEDVIVLHGDSKAGSRAGSTTVVSELIAEGGDGDDSDEERDVFLTRRSPPSVEDDSDDKNLTYRQIDISAIPYMTYRAVLLYLHSGDITFAPLSSALLPSNPAAKQTREQMLDQHHLTKTPSPLSPFPRLSQIRLPPCPPSRDPFSLRLRLALAVLKSQLTAANAAQDLFSSIGVYDDACEAILDFVVAHWKDVKASERMKQIRRMVGAGELPQGRLL
jgi:hypothetical protein